MNNSKVCPACGCSDFNIVNRDKDVQLDFFQTLNVSYDSFECNVCGFAGEDSNDSYLVSYNAQKEASDKITAQKLMAENHKVGIKDVHFERCLGLPPRTLNRWKSQGRPSGAGLALLKLVNTYEWLLDVADYGYEPEYARKILVKKALEEVNTTREEAGGASAWVFMDHGNGSRTMTFSQGNESPAQEEEALIYRDISDYKLAVG